MSPEIWIWIGVGLLVFLVLHLFASAYAARCVYVATLKRKDKDHWGRTVSEQEPHQLKMDAEGLVWQEEHDRFKQDVHIVHAGLDLYGEYYDMGGKAAVIILSGRTESLRYGYYFSRPYSQAGLNVLVIDPRAHGLSDGVYNTVGFEESKDALAWARFLHEEKGVEEILFHGICIGAAAGMLAITSQDAPGYLVGLVTEGMFANFGESMKNHLIERKKLFFPVMQCIDMWMKHYTGHSMMRGPIDVIHKMDRPLLMIQSKMDPYSTPQNAQVMYDKCPSREKELVWYATGGHSQLRLTDTQRYDSAITAFLQRIGSTSKT